MVYETRTSAAGRAIEPEGLSAVYRNKAPRVQAPVMGGGRSVTDVLVDIASSVQDILRSEIRLAQSEVGEQLIRVRAAGLLVAVGLGGGMLSGFFALLAVFSTLRLLMPPWAAALCIAAAAALIATIALRVGLRLLERVRPALKTVESPKETMEWPGPPQTK